MSMRRNLIVALVGLVALACGSTTTPAPASPKALQPVTVKVSLPGLQPAFAFADIAVAQANGFFQEQSLTVQTEGLSSGVKTVQSVVAGDSDIGASSIEPVLGAAAQGRLEIVGSYADRLPVVLETPASLATPADLKGRNLGIQDVGAFREVMTRAVYQQAGMTQGDVHYVSVADTGYVSALVTHRIDSAILQPEQSVDAEQKDPALHVLTDLYKLMPQYYYGTFFVRSDWLSANRGAVTRFLTAVTKAHRLIYRNRARVVPEIATATGFPAAVIDKAYDRAVVQNGVFPVNQSLDSQRLVYTEGKMKTLGLLPGGSPDLGRVVDRGPIDAAVASLGVMKGDPRWR